MKNDLKNIGEVVSTSTSIRIKELDGLRGIAILLVVSFHYISVQLSNSTNKLGKLLAKITSFGWVGVDFFFVLSGFLICSILLKYKNSKNFFSTFYSRRVLRIVPNYFLLIVIYILLSDLPFFYNCTFLNGGNVIPLWSYFAMVHNFYMANANSLGNRSMSITWSIGIEEQFYVIFPIVIYFFKKKALFIFLIIAIIAASIFRLLYANWVPQYALLQCRMDSIACGAIIAIINFYMNIKTLVDKYSGILFFMLFADVAMCFFLYHIYDDLGPVKHTLFAVFFSGLLLLALTKQSTVYGSLLRNKILTWIGAISYSLYLFHYIILGSLQFVISGRKDIEITNGKDILVTFVALVVSFLFSLFIYKFFETPMVLFGKKIKY